MLKSLTFVQLHHSIVAGLTQGIVLPARAD